MTDASNQASRLVAEFSARVHTVQSAEDFEALLCEYHVACARSLAERVSLEYPVPGNNDAEDPPFDHCVSLMRSILDAHREMGLPGDLTLRIRKAANAAFWNRYGELLGIDRTGGVA